MTTTYASCTMVAGGKPYIFSFDATDGAEGTLVNVVSSRGLGDTFAGGATITAIGPVLLNSSDGTGASKSILGGVITDPQNNVVQFVSWVDPETAPVPSLSPCNIPVGLNYSFKILTSNT